MGKDGNVMGKNSISGGFDGTYIQGGFSIAMFD
jgi:hypothetical protein